MIVYGDPETWGMTVDQFLDSRRLERESFADGTNPKIKMILDMLRRGMDVDTISTITGATIEEINAVAKKAKPISTEKPVGPEEGISKNKTYSEIDILSNIEAKFPGGNTRDDIVYNPMPNPVPRMDEYMPEFEGLEDPKYRQSELADGGIVEREELKGGTALDKGNISVQSKRGSNVVYGMIFPGGKEQEKEFYQAVRERYSNIKPRGETYSANWFAKTFPISERQARRAIAYIRDKEKLEYREHLPTEKYLSNKRRREAIKKYGGIQTSPFSGTKETNLSHLDDIYSQYIKGSNIGYAPRAINEKLGESDGIDFKIRALYEKRNKLLKENPKDIVKQLEDINLKGARLSGEAKGFKQFTLQDPITGKQSVIGGGKFTIDPTDQFEGMTERQIQDFIRNANPKDFDSQLKIKLFQENRKASFEAAKKFPKKKIETIINNIGCSTGSLKAANGSNCYIKGVEKIQSGNLNQNEFNILKKAINSPAAQTALKYGKGALKILGPILTPLVAYDTFKSYKEGKPAFEILEEGLIGTGLARGIREAQTYTPEEREAIAQKKQYAREEEDYSGLSSDFNIPSNMSTDQIDLLSVTGPKRVEEKLAAEDAARAAERVYEGDPGFISETGYDVEERTGFKKGSKDKDSPVIPISPLTDLPQNESRRDFLKGIGAVGLGAAALGSGLLKLGKAAAPISEITKIVKGTTAPSWMDSLITKILKEGVELKLDPNSNVLVKKVKFKNPKTGVEEEATLTFDKQKNSYEIEYSSDETVGGKYGDKVFLKVEPEYVYDPQSQKMVPTGKHKFNAIEAEPEIVNPDGDIEMTGENVASKIIDLRSDISGLKSYVTGGKGINKKVVKEKEALVKRAEEDPLADIEDNPRYSPRHYDLDEFSN
jgi:hypothetical protein